MMSLDINLFNLKLGVKQLFRDSRKLLQEGKLEKEMCKKALHDGDHTTAREHAGNAIRNTHKVIRLQRIISKFNIMLEEVQNAMTVNCPSSTMTGIILTLEAELKTGDLDKIQDLLCEFESCQEVGTAVPNCNSSSSEHPTEAEIDELLTEVAEGSMTSQHLLH